MTRQDRNHAARSRGYSGCGRCGDTWDWKPSHTTPYCGRPGCFPLCEECWSSLTPSTRLPYYLQLVDLWESMSVSRDYDTIRESLTAHVLAGE